MNTVKVHKAELLAKVIENRAKHHAAVIESQAGYRKEVIRELNRMLKDARSGKKIRVVIALPVPMDHTADYDRVIDMLTMSTDEIIELTSMAFDQFVRDKWGWSSMFAASNKAYASTTATMDYLESKEAE